VLITFLSLLELGKMGFVSLFQTEAYADIYIEAKKTVEGDVLSSVEEYGSVNAEAMAEKMIADSEKEGANFNPDEDFILKDAEDSVQMGLVPAAPEQFLTDEFIISNEMASDEEIIAAEKELLNEGETLG
jgi:segregation and condensation protein A